MRCLLPLLFLSLGCSRAAPIVIGAVDDAPRGTHGIFLDELLASGKQIRTYRLVVPKSVDLEKPAPVVIAFHGMLIDSKDLMPKYTKLDDLPADKKFIVVYPEAEGRSWGCCRVALRAARPTNALRHQGRPQVPCDERSRRQVQEGGLGRELRRGGRDGP